MASELYLETQEEDTENAREMFLLSLSELKSSTKVTHMKELAEKIRVFEDKDELTEEQTQEYDQLKSEFVRLSAT